MGKINKARFWTGVLYPENMVTDWADKIGDLVQVPYAYCVHSKDTDTKSDHRKDHVHVILSFPNTTTYNHAMEVFELLSAPEKKALNTCQAVVSIRGAYDYLIHDTDACRKAQKHLYDKSERITGNNFDIGSYEQLSKVDKLSIQKELADVIVLNNFTDFTDFYKYVVSNYDDTNYFETVVTYSGFFERLTRGNYLHQNNQNGI